MIQRTADSFAFGDECRASRQVGQALVAAAAGHCRRRRRWRDRLDDGRSLDEIGRTQLVSALARAALGRAAAWLALTVVFGTSAWLLIITFLVILLHSFGLSWLVSALIAATINLAITALAAWRVVVYARHTGLQATRRQLARMGLLRDDEDEDEDEDGNEAGPARSDTPAPAAAPGAGGPAA